jgi:DNA-binding LytR/AlgR family response regulator
MKIEALIIEDETPAQAHLIRLLKKVEPDISVITALTNISDSISWLSKHSVDLIFMDIHLSDGLSFSIFEQVKVETPIIFTTAYDAYAIKAFKVSSVDYLLKPIDEEDLKLGISKFKNLKKYNSENELNMLRLALTNPNSYQERFMVQKGEQLQSITLDQIAYFEGEDRYVYLVKKDGGRFIIDYKLADLEKILNPNTFFRLNRSFITCFAAIAQMHNLSKSRVKVALVPSPKREVIVSSENNQTFKKWLNH